MADIELVIKIPEEMYKNIQNKSTEIQAEGYIVENAILNGTLLPKGHGRLIDADKLLENACQVYDKVRHMWSPDFVVNTEYIYSAPTIIEGSESK